jgi:hypothetical protein
MDSLAIVDQDRTVIRLPSWTLAYSLFLRLSEIRGVGERGYGQHADALGEVTLGEFPRRPEQVKDVLDVVAAWLDEIGHTEVTVEFHWQVRQSAKGKTRASRPVLCWKYEDGPEDAPPNGSPDDMGPAWLQTQDAYGNVMSEPVADGEWISRQKAYSLAADMDYTLSVDD